MSGKTFEDKSMSGAAWLVALVTIAAVLGLIISKPVESVGVVLFFYALFKLAAKAQG